MGVLSNYCGLGGSGIPQHTVDAICKQHDEDYAKIQEEKGKFYPYLVFNWADQKMLHALEAHIPEGKREEILQRTAKGLWKAKRSVTNLLTPAQVEQATTARKRLRSGIDPVDPDAKVIKREFNLLQPDTWFEADRNPTRDPFFDKPGNHKTEKMEMEDEEKPTETMAAKSSSNTSHGKHETSVIPQTPHFGIPECHTAILPFTMYFSAFTSAQSNQSSQDFRFRTTSIQDIFVDSITSVSGGAAYAKGLFDKVVGSQTTGLFHASAIAFPSTPAAGSVTTDRPAWRDWFVKQYEVYNVNECQWEITFHNPRGSVNSDVLVAYGEEAHGSSVGNEFPTASVISQTEHWPGLKWDIIHSQGDEGENQNWKVISGTYKPGQAKKNVRNDEDVKTWTPVDNVPDLKEQIHFKIWKAPFNDSGNSNFVGLNCRLHLRLIVQFRDLKQALRYPTVAGTLDLSAPTDVLQSPF